MSVLSVNNLSVVKRDRLLFSKVNFVVNPGSLTYLKGVNGAGKTSLLRVLAGLVEPESGEVLFQGENIQNCRNDYAGNLVYFGHKLGVNQTLSAVENILFWCQLHNVATSTNRVYEVLASLNLVGLEDIPITHLSAGQQRRVALARFWFKDNAKLWILDEPFTALDVDGIALLNHHIIEFLTKGGAVVMTSHQSLQIDYPTAEVTLEYKI
ncbi:cytochrome c biogenesis heme-transporting ATPase CcmA [Paraglaciecola sp. 2405UD69-4]|uniref:cytochrome c biogenesis heme-transporting ATPase CcmA n=1 Tax=Paraglaciecola sp. 2405UD69-4 TaxID=3391836 RepID=UPI0039C9574C